MNDLELLDQNIHENNILIRRDEDIYMFNIDSGKGEEDLKKLKTLDDGIIKDKTYFLTELTKEINTDIYPHVYIIKDPYMCIHYGRNKSYGTLFTVFNIFNDKIIDEFEINNYTRYCEVIMLSSDRILYSQNHGSIYLFCIGEKPIEYKMGHSRLKYCCESSSDPNIIIVIDEKFISSLNLKTKEYKTLSNNFGKVVDKIVASKYHKNRYIITTYSTIYFMMEEYTILEIAKFDYMGVTPDYQEECQIKVIELNSETLLAKSYYRDQAYILDISENIQEEVFMKTGLDIIDLMTVNKIATKEFAHGTKENYDITIYDSSQTKLKTFTMKEITNVIQIPKKYKKYRDYIASYLSKFIPMNIYNIIGRLII